MTSFILITNRSISTTNRGMYLVTRVSLENRIHEACEKLTKAKEEQGQCCKDVEVHAHTPERKRDMERLLMCVESNLSSHISLKP